MSSPGKIRITAISEILPAGASEEGISDKITLRQIDFDIILSPEIVNNFNINHPSFSIKMVDSLVLIVIELAFQADNKNYSINDLSLARNSTILIHLTYADAVEKDFLFRGKLVYSTCPPLIFEYEAP